MINVWLSFFVILLPASAFADSPVHHHGDDSIAIDGNFSVESAASNDYYAKVSASTRRQDAQEDESELVEQIQQLSESVVSIAFDRANERFDSTGVVISPNGWVLSHGHHNRGVLEKGESQANAPSIVDVLLNSNRRVQARIVMVVGTGNVEYSLLRIEGVKELPFSPVASAQPKPGESCLMLGHPHGYVSGRPPVARRGKIAYAGKGALVSNCLVSAGDSGSPLFNDQGEVIGILTSQVRLLAKFTNAVSAISNRNTLQLLQNAEQLSEVSSEFATPLFAHELAEKTKSSVVKVLCGSRLVALGTVLDPNGYLVTKASQLDRSPKCVFPGGETVDARIVRQFDQYDMAILKVEMENPLSVIPFSNRELERGIFLTSVGWNGDAIATSIISDARKFNVPPERSMPNVARVETSDDGLIKVMEITEGETQFQVGDFIKSIDGNRFTDIQQYGVWWYNDSPPAGSFVEYLVIRDKQEIKLIERCRPATLHESHSLQQQGIVSLRRTGFQDAFAHDAPLRASQCGGPIVDLSGKLVGINIARSNRHESVAIPADICHRVVSETLGDLNAK